MKIRIDNRYIVPLAVLLVFTAIYLVTDFRQLRDAAATGGAFTSGLTKHGGGTIDTESYDGVNRQIGSPFEFGAAYYDDLAGEAGEYEAGECMHCHEPHASFGTAEPPPNPDSFPADLTAPNEYLLFMANGNDLCWYCHNELDVGYDPFVAEQGEGHWGFYQGAAEFQASSHGTDTGFLWPGDGDLTNDGSTWPRTTVRTAGDDRKCINCHSPHGVAGSHDLLAGGPTTGNWVVDSTVTTTTIPRQLIAREEALCLNCHDGTPASTNIKEQVDGHLSASSSGHPVRSSITYGRHDLANETESTDRLAGWLTNANAHAECTDCHNPHLVKPGVRFGRAAPYDSRVKIGEVNRGIWGVTVNEAAGTAGLPIVDLDSSTHNLYQLCFKCHSAWAMGDAINSTSSVNAGVGDPYDDLTDVPSEFDTSNYGYHPVFGVGRNNPPCGANSNWPGGGAAGSGHSGSGAASVAPDGDCGLSNTFVAPYKHTAIITCVDCHRYGDGNVATDDLAKAEGPHGSANRWLLRDVDDTITVNGVLINSGADNWLCFNCHRRDVYGDSGYNNPTNANYSRLQGHPYPGNSTEISASNFFNIGCRNCHAGDQPGALHGTTKTNIGLDNSLSACADCARIGTRLRNGASVPGFRILGINGAAVNTCFSNTSINVTSAGNSCSQGHAKTYSVNYAYSTE